MGHAHSRHGVQRVGHQVPNSETETTSAIVRNRLFPYELLSLPFPDQPDINTCWRTFERAVITYAAEPCLGERQLKENGEAGPYVFRTYKEVQEDVAKIGTALSNLGLKPGTPVAIYGVNCASWTTALLALWRQGLVCVPLYDTLGKDATSYILKDAEVGVVLCAHEQLKNVLDIAAECKLNHVIQFEPLTDEDRAHPVPSPFAAWCMDDLRNDVHETKEPHASGPQDLAYIMYTSGTTGRPKGVELTHANMLASVCGIMHTGANIVHSDVYLSYLPLAHVFEAAMQILALASGASMGYFQGDIKKLLSDIQTLRPTIFAGVPRVYSRFYDKVLQRVESSGTLKHALFNAAYRQQLHHVRTGTRGHLWDSLIFNKTKAFMGGRIRLMASGAAPLPAHINDFLKVVFCCDVLQGYGLTETSCAACITPVGYTPAGNIGEPVACCEVRLADVPELNYRHTDKPHPRGELCVRGPNVFGKYHNLPERTKGALDDDGWLHTGDIAQLLDDGAIQVIDRMKNIFKLAQGEYVAAEELECLFLRSKYVSQIFIYGDSKQCHIVAVVVPQIETLAPWMKDNGIDASNFKEACRQPKVKKFLMENIEATANEAHVATFKIPKDIYVEGDLNDLNQGFSIENECLTPTFKLKRPQLQKRYQKQIDAMYEAINKGE